MFPSFRACGTWPSVSDMLYSIPSGNPIDDAVSFRTREWNPSGPDDLFVFNLDNLFSTIC